MGNEHGQEWRSSVPYEPAEADRGALARAVRDTLIAYRLDGFQTIVRFQNGHRYKVAIPHGEELLRHVRFESRGSDKGLVDLSAIIELPCPDPDGYFLGDPYCEIIDLRFKAKEWVMPDARAVDEIMREEGVSDRHPRGGGVSTNRAVVVAALAGVLFAGALAAEHIGGIVSATQKKLNDAYDSVMEEMRRDPRPSPPIQLPEPWIRY